MHHHNDNFNYNLTHLLLYIFFYNRSLIFFCFNAVWTTVFAASYVLWFIDGAVHILASIASSIAWLFVTTALWVSVTCLDVLHFLLLNAHTYTRTMVILMKHDRLLLQVSCYIPEGEGTAPDLLRSPGVSTCFGCLLMMMTYMLKRNDLAGADSLLPCLLSAGLNLASPL